MPDVTKVEVGDATLFVETRRLGPQQDLEAPGPDLDRPGSDFDGPGSDLEGLGGRLPDLSSVTEALSSFAGQIGEALHQAAPDRATVEFGCQLGLEAGRLTALVVQGSANASLRVTLEWVKTPH
ncbi:CU044_2847 family protein [Streptomyces globisporus]|uniref:CU044_2847 family protein n=1 Tax=Streptomyces globisporus TaxID=1908 RepID=UPI00068CC75D|nr:CU044_2847 family protein [Streptomyces globisporus]